MNDEVQQVSKQQRNKSRLAFVGLFALFLAPVLVAIVMHSIEGGIGTASTSNRGELVKPVQALAEFNFETVAGEKINLETFKGSWSLITIDSANCDKQCEENLYKIRQSRLGTGGEKERVQRLMVLTDGKPSESLSALLKEHPGMHVSSVSGPALDKFMQAFNHDGKAVGGQRIYIVDPFGNLMMQYAPTNTAKDVVKDLEKLLRYSRTG